MEAHLLAGGPALVVPLLGSPVFHQSLLELGGKRWPKGVTVSHMLFRMLLGPRSFGVTW